MLKQTRQKGFTLIEMTLVMMIMSFLILGVVGLFLAMFKGQAKTNALARIKQEGDLSTVAIEQQLRDGYYVDQLCPLDSTVEGWGNQLKIYKRDLAGKTVCSLLKLNTSRIVVWDYEDRNCAGINYTERFLTSDQMNVSTLKISCQVGGQFDHDLVKVEYDIQDKKETSTKIPFRIITALRNVRGVN